MRTYVAGILSSVSGLTAFAYVPKNEPVNDLALIVKMTSRESRDTLGPRATLGTAGGGDKVIRWTVQVELCTVDIDEGTAVEHMDDMYQSTLTALRQAVIPAAITDSVSGETSTISLIGEEVEIADDYVEQLGAEGQEAAVMAALVISVTVVERVTT